MARLGLRLRVFLFFALMAVGALLIAAGAMAFVANRSDAIVPMGVMITTLVLFGFVNTGLIVSIWLLFDENIAKPILGLSAELRLKAGDPNDAAMRADGAVYLGDLAPAAAALSEKAKTSVSATAALVAKQTARLQAEHRAFRTLLSESPIASILVSPAHDILLYDAQAAEVLSQIAPPRLHAPLSDYFEDDDLQTACAAAQGQSAIVKHHLSPANGAPKIKARFKALSDGGFMIFVDPPRKTENARPLAFDFSPGAFNDQPLTQRPVSELCFVVLDLETTGLSPASDEIVQMAAVRVLNGSLVQGEELNLLVHPGRPIPPASTEIHGITDADVIGAPDAITACRKLHAFAQDAVLVAHNVPFDLGFLKKTAATADMRWDNPVLDTVLLSALVFGVTEDHSLDALCARLSITIPTDDRHTARGDALATAHALLALLKVAQARGYETMDTLQKSLRPFADRLYPKGAERLPV
ncbi:MAG: exonuclease domain-containing protein [Pseudomonadota bacterium]